MGNRSSRISDLLLGALYDLSLEDLKRFKDKLSYSDFEGKGTIPRGRLENADAIDTKNLLMEFYGGDAAVNVTINVFTQINLRDSAAKLRKEREKDLHPNEKPSELSAKDYRKKYKEDIQKKYRVIKDMNSRFGESVILNTRYTKLTIVDKPCHAKEREHEIMAMGRRHAEIMTKRAHSVITTETLFKPDEDRQTPQVVVLLGAAGIGKTMTAKKIMCDWAAGEIYNEKFDYVFYINCREMNYLTKQGSVADLIRKNCPNSNTPVSEILVKPEKLLFIIDGFDELRFSLDQSEDNLCSDPWEMKPVEIILSSLFRKTVLPTSHLLITMRPTALEKLEQCLECSRYAEILGFCEAEREEYFHKFFGNERQARQALRFVRENEILFTMCFVPIVCWIICTVVKQQLEKGEDLAQTSKTVTGVYMLYLSSLVKPLCSNMKKHLQANLRGLCSLAADGIWKQKILFEEEEIKMLGLDQADSLPLFLNENIFQKDIDYECLYSFIHLSFQEFFAAMFYVLEDDEETAKKSLTSKKDVNHLLKTYGKYKNNYMMVTVHFLFGLLNKERLNDMEKKLHCKTSPAIKLDLLRWFEAEAKKFSSLPYKTSEELRDQLELFHCLYEYQEEEFAKRAMDNFQEIRLEHIRLTTMDEIALSFCVKNCCSKQSLYLCNCTLGIGEREEGWRAKLRKQLFPLSRQTKELRNSTPYSLCQGLKDPNCKLKTISLSSCKLSSAFPEDLSPKTLFTKHSLEKLDLSANTLGDSGLKHLCEGLKHPHCKLQTLLLWQCSLTAACCGDLAAALSTNQSLTELELSGNELGDSGIKLLCNGLKHPSCKLQKLVVWDCHLTDACCGDLSSLLSTNRSLRELNLSGNNLSYSGVKLLCEGLKHPNCKLEKLDLSENPIDEITTKELDTLKMIKPGLSIVHYAPLSPESPGAKRSRMALLLSQRHTYTSRVRTSIAEFMWYIFVVHWEVGLVLLLSM
ncbi:NLR family pyrin domain containing 3, partial [Chelydra serpentina]